MEEEIRYLRSLPSIRERSSVFLTKALEEDSLPNFSVHLDKLPEVLRVIKQTMQDTYEGKIENVPFHSRWRHFEPKDPERISKMIATWENVDDIEKARRLIDLVLVSVLLDAGAGSTWSFKEPKTDWVFTRSEGLGIASLYMFLDGIFSSNKDRPHRVDAEALFNLPSDAVAIAFQVAPDTNPLVGCEGRTTLLQKLGECLKLHPEFFSNEDRSEFRPGFLVDYLLKKSEAGVTSIHSLWEVVIYGLEEMWPAGRTRLGNSNMGDVWPHSILPQDTEASKLVSFHKLSQWLTYSMIEPLEQSGIKITGLDQMTGLPEYRNGGLFVDTGVLVPKHENILTDAFDPGSEVIVEWRALTIGLLDKVYEAWKTEFNLTSEAFPMVKLLEAGTWKSGRVLAQAKRDGLPPIRIQSDGTVF